MSNHAFIIFALACAVCVHSTDAAGSASVTAVELKSLLNAPLSDHKHVFAEFYAPWCGHCKSLAPKWDWVADKINAQPEAGVVIVKIDADKHKSELTKFGVQGFPTLILFKGDEDGNRSPVKYESAREPKQMLKFINLKTGSSFTWDDYVAAPAPASRESSPSAMKLYAAFKLANEFKYTEAEASLTALSASDDARTARSAGRVLEKVKMIGLEHGDFTVEDWLQVDLETFQPPVIADDGSLTLLCRLDFRSSSRADLEPLIEDFLAIPGASVIRVTGAEVDIPGDILYPIGLSEGKALLSGRGLQRQLVDMQSAMIVQNGKVIWNAHLGILDKVLIASLTKIAEGTEYTALDAAEPACDSDPEDDEGSCKEPPAHDEL